MNEQLICDTCKHHYLDHQRGDGKVAGACLKPDCDCLAFRTPDPEINPASKMGHYATPKAKPDTFLKFGR